MRSGGSTLRRFVWAAALGSLLALIADVLLLSYGDTGLIGQAGAAGSLLDVQAQAFRHGSLAVDPGQAGIEGFVTGDKTYLYFGPVLPLLHLPFLLIDGGLQGHLTQLSLVAAYVVLLLATAALHWGVRRFLRPDAPLGRTDLAGAFLLPVSVGAGAIPLYLAGWAASYHEVELWGAALTIAALAVLVRFLRAPTVRGAVWAGVLATLAVNVRLSVGSAAVAALGAGAVLLLVGAWAARRAGQDEVARGGGGRLTRAAAFLGTFGPTVPAGRRIRLAVALLLAALVPILTSSALNQAKFDQPFGLPLERQVISHIDPGRIAALKANPDGLFGMQFVPTAVLQYLRPDAVGLSRAFPFVGTPAHRPTTVGDVHFDTLEPSLSAPSSMLLFCLLSLVAFVLLLRPPGRRPLWTILVTTSVGLIASLTLAYVSTRYLTDLLPMLVVGGAAGLQLLVGRVCEGAAASRNRRWGLLGAVAALVLVGFVVNGATGLTSQQLLHPGTPMADRAAFVRLQDDVDDVLGRTPGGIRTGATLPAEVVGAPGDLFVVGKCEGLYTVPLSGSWLAVERTAGTGLHPLLVRYPASTGGRWEPVATVGTGNDRVTLLVRGTSAAMTFATQVPGRDRSIGRTLAVPAGRVVPTTISIEPLFFRLATIVTVDGQSAIVGPTNGAVGTTVVPGRDPEAPALGTFSGTVRVLPTDAPVCRQLAKRAGLSL